MIFFLKSFSLLKDFFFIVNLGCGGKVTLIAAKFKI